MFNFDEKFIKKIVSKDKSAFNEFYLKTVDVFFSYINSRYNIDKNQAYDIISDFYVKFWNNISKYDEKNKFSSYVWTIFTNLLKDYFKKTKEVNFSDFAQNYDWDFFEDTLATDDDMNNLLDSDFTMEQIKRALKLIPFDDQEIIFLKYMEEQTYSEISEILQIPEDTARKRLSRAMAKLKKKLKL